MATRDPNNPDTTVAVQASAWLRIGEVLEEAADMLRSVLNRDESEPLPWRFRERMQNWLDEYDAHQIPQQESHQ